jgi:HK97 family phage major capsid protein
MPDVNEYETEKDWMSACVPAMIEEGKEQDQAVAACMSMWARKSVDVTPAPEFADPDDSLKIGARNSARDAERLQQIHDFAVENGAQCKPAPEVVMLSLDEETLVTYGDEIKALPDGKIGGYLVKFSTADDPDASPQRDYFDAKTDFGFKRGTRKTTPIWFNHRIPIKAANGAEIAIKEQIGEGELEILDDGVFVEAVLYNRKRYEAALAAMGWSSGTAAHLVERKPVKGANHVACWPLGLDASITPTPAEPRTQVIPLKSLSDNTSLLPPLPSEPEPEADAERATEEQGEGGQLSVKSNLEVFTMDITEEKLQEIVQAAVKQGAEEAIKALPAEPVKAGISVTRDEGDQPFSSPGEFFKAVKTAAYYPRDEDPRLRPLKATGLSEGVPADGGYLLNPQMQAGVLERMYDVNSILSMCAQDAVTGNSMLYNGVDETSHASSLYGGLVGYWMGEAASITATKPVFYQVELKLKKIAALAYATEEQLEDTAFLDSWLMRTVPNVLRWYVEEAIINGDGVGKPLGIMNSPCLVTSNRDTASHIYLADVANMWKRRWRGVNDYVWLIEGGASSELHTMTAATAPIYMPAGNVAGSPFGTLYGRPVIETEHCQALNTTGDIILASLSQYQTIVKGGVQASKSIHVAYTTGEVAFRFTFRIDGSPLWQSALTPAHGSNTVSPFVCLVSAST